MLERGHYHDGRLIMIAPALVTERYLDFEPVHRALADTFRPAAGTL